jgi:hypothetical protein
VKEFYGHKFEGILESPVVCSFNIEGDELILEYDDNDIWKFWKKSE